MCKYECVSPMSTGPTPRGPVVTCLTSLPHRNRETSMYNYIKRSLNNRKEIKK